MQPSSSIPKRQPVRAAESKELRTAFIAQCAFISSAFSRTFCRVNYALFSANYAADKLLKFCRKFTHVNMLIRRSNFTPLRALLCVSLAAAPLIANATGGPDAQAVKDDRLKILRDERIDIAKRLDKATAEVPKANDKEAAEKAVARLRGDLTAIEKEIQRVEGQKPVNLVVARPPERAASVAQEGEAKGITYRPWDVFKDFGK